MNSMPMVDFPLPAREFVDYKQPSHQSGFEATIISTTSGAHATEPSGNELVLVPSPSPLLSMVVVMVGRVHVDNRVAGAPGR
jgi:hypothetical protein